jgi:lipoprotein-releasing system permease protein
VPRPQVEPTETVVIARRIEPSPQRLRSIDQWPMVMASVERTPGVIAAAPSITGAGFAVRSDAKSPIVVRGVEPERFLSIIDVRTKLVAGRFELDGDHVVIGS